MTDKKNSKGPIWPTAAMATHLNITPRRLQQLENDGVVEKQSRGKWYMIETTEKYIKYLQLQAHGTKLSEDESGDAGSVTDENILLKRERRRTIEMQNKKAAGELHESKDVERLLNGMAATVRTKLLTLPTKLAASVAGIRDVNQIQMLLDTDIREALTELSEYDPKMFIEEKDNDGS